VLVAIALNDHRRVCVIDSGILQVIFHQKDLKYGHEGPESLYVVKERCCFDKIKLLRLMFEQLTTNDTLLKQVFHQSGEIDKVLLKQVFQQWVESMVCYGNRYFSNGKSWVMLLKQEF